MNRTNREVGKKRKKNSQVSKAGAWRENEKEGDGRKVSV